MGIIVKIDNERVYVDCGAAAPFFKPVRFERNPQNVSQFGDDKVHLLPVQAEKNEYKYVRYFQGKQNGKTWEFNSAQQFKVSDFNQVIQQSNTPKAPFMVILRCQLWQTEQRRSVSLVNNKFGIRYSDGHTIIKKLNSTKEIEEVIVDEFRLPKLPVSEAINVLNDLNIDIFSE